MKAIIFDFGNVVGFFDHRRALSKLRQHTDLSEAEVIAAIVDGKLEDAYESGKMTTDEFFQAVIQRCGYRCSADVLEATFGDIFWPNADVCALIPRLKKDYRLVLGSNTCVVHSRQFKRQFAETLSHFDALVLSHEIGVRKPLAAFFEHCRDRTGYAAQECLFIDDLPANIAGAQACGMHGIVYRDFDDLTQRLCKLEILATDGYEPKAATD